MARTSDDRDLAWRAAAAGATILAALATSMPARAQLVCPLELVSVSSGGQQGNTHSSMGTLTGGGVSADGRFVVFWSPSSNLATDANPNSDVFLRDRVLGTTEVVSLTYLGEAANASCAACQITPDGRYVLFGAYATNLVPNDTNGLQDVFIRDRQLGLTERVNVSSTGEQSNGLSGPISFSATGRYVAFANAGTNLVLGDANGAYDVFVRDRQAGITTRVSADSSGNSGNGDAFSCYISANGRWVTFESVATNLVSGDSNAWNDVFVHDRNTGATTRVSVSSSGAQGNGPSGIPAISADGRWIAFYSSANNLVLGDTNQQGDIFVHDRVTGETARVSVGTGGYQANDASVYCCITPDGRYIAFESSASNLFPGDSNGWDIFLHDRWRNETTLVSQSSAGVQASSQALRPSISADGTLVAFFSLATNLVPGDINGANDVFARVCIPSDPYSYCAPKINSLGCVPAITSNGDPSATAPSGFVIVADEVRNNKFGLLFYGLAGPAVIPFQGGILCVQTPIRRTSVQASGGSAPPASDCSGSYQLDFNAYIASGQDPALVLGQGVWAQYWSRDPGFAPPNGTGLTNGLAFTIGP